MPFYDEVKRQIRGAGEQVADNEERDMGFDELKQKAEDGGGNAERRGDDTVIEVLQDGELRPEGGEGDAGPQPSREAQDTVQRAVERSPAMQPATDPDVAALLERVTKQNREIIGLLRGIKRGLER